MIIAAYAPDVVVVIQDIIGVTRVGLLLVWEKIK
jgi:hypothetical protein